MQIDSGTAELALASVSMGKYLDSNFQLTFGCLASWIMELYWYPNFFQRRDLFRENDTCCYSYTILGPLDLFVPSVDATPPSRAPRHKFAEVLPIPSPYTLIGKECA